MFENEITSAMGTTIATFSAGLMILVGTIIVAWKRTGNARLTQSINLVELYDDKFREYEKKKDSESMLSALEQLLMYRSAGAMDKQVFYCAYSAIMKRYARNEGALKYIMKERAEHPDEKLFDYILAYWKEQKINVKKVDIDS